MQNKRYDAGDFAYVEDYEAPWFECPDPRCNKSVHPGPYDTLGDIVSAAKAHLLEKHSD